MVICWCQNTETLTDIKIIMVVWQSNPDGWSPITMIRHSDRSLDAVFLLWIFFIPMCHFRWWWLGILPGEQWLKLCKILADWMQTHDEGTWWYRLYFVERGPECFSGGYPLPWPLAWETLAIRDAQTSMRFFLCPHLASVMFKACSGVGSDWGGLLFL